MIFALSLLSNMVTAVGSGVGAEELSLLEKSLGLKTGNKYSGQGERKVRGEESSKVRPAGTLEQASAQGTLLRLLYCACVFRARSSPPPRLIPDLSTLSLFPSPTAFLL